MILDWSRVNVYLYPGAVDMRKQINGLAAMVEEEVHANPFSGNVFLFCNGRRTHLKALFWEKNGFCWRSNGLSKTAFPGHGMGRRYGS